jgi:hypothetical protein
MTIKEISIELKCNSRTIRRLIEKLYPNRMKRGKTTNFNKSEYDLIKEKYLNNNYKAKREAKYNHGYVYIIHDIHGLTKIGITCNVRERNSNYITENPYLKYSYFAKFDIKKYEHVERLLHKRFKDYRIIGEWFKLFDNQVNYIIEYFKDNAFEVTYKKYKNIANINPS